MVGAFTWALVAQTVKKARAGIGTCMVRALVSL